MILKLKDYIGSKPHILKAYEARGLKKTVELMVMSGVPLVAGYLYIMEKFPEADLQSRIDDLVEFYGYTGIEE